jgi:bromodomain-containing protein 7/9
LRGLNSQKNNNQNSNSSSPSNLHGSDSNAGGGNQEDGIRRRKISAVRLGSDDLVIISPRI